ncbi:aminopeptidase P family protein [Candidatus Gottesmanbacteria bacterium]|nr:aminopeptidase P family protein [Candidatus Gottesmanbacteria bacterium]
MKNILAGLDVLLITNPTNIRYLTGFVGVDARERESYVLLTKDTVYLFTNSLYKEAAQKLSNPTNPTNNPMTCVEISREEPFSKKLTEILKRSHLALQGETLQGIRFGFEETDLTVAEYNKLKQELKNVMLVPTKNRIEELRMIKRSDEIANIRAAAKLTDQCFDFILGKIKRGVTEAEIAWEIESFFRKRGAGLAFSPIVAFGKNTSQPHYSPNFTRPRLEVEARQGEALKNNTVILLDFGARVAGYCSDMTRVVFIGKPKDEWRRAYEVVLEAQQAALEYINCHSGLDPESSHSQTLDPGSEAGMTKPLSGAKTDRLAREVIKKAGLPPCPHSLGHGVGLAIHEIPRLTARKDRILPKSQPRKDAILLSDMVFTIEPAVYVEGEYGIRIEDLILLKKDGIEVLSKSSKTLTIL